jgi:LCP family protein required for cell wall assembly
MRWWDGFWLRLLASFVAVSLIAVGSVFAADRVGSHEFAKRSTFHFSAGVLSDEKPADPANYLLLGRDGTGNSDTMMVLHIDPTDPVPLVVSFPRDLMVDVPGYGRRQLNSAFGLGGPELVLRTFTETFKVPIQHFFQVDFSSFPSIVNAIGNVKLWFDTPVHDPYIGLEVLQRGCVALNGNQALGYVRSRHYYVPHDPAHPAPWTWDYPHQRGGAGWDVEGSDVQGRIQRQQYFLRTLAQTALDKTRHSPLRLLHLVDHLMAGLTTDQKLTVGQMKRLVYTFRSVNPADVKTTTIPWKPDPANPNRVVISDPDATRVLDVLRNLTPPAAFVPRLVDPSTVRVGVENGSGVPGLGAKVLDELRAAGFQPAGRAIDAARDDYTKTEVRWVPNAKNEGVTVVVATGAPVARQVHSRAETSGADVVVVVGRDWNRLTHAYGSMIGAQHRHAGSSGSSGTTAPPGPTTTTTTVDPRFIPVDPRTGKVLVGCPAPRRS